MSDDINEQLKKVTKSVMDMSDLSEFDAQMVVGGVVKAMDENDITLVAGITDLYTCVDCNKTILLPSDVNCCPYCACGNLELIG